MRFYPDAPDRVTRIRTYFVPNDREFVPWPHAFGSRVWEYQEEPDPPFGELNGPRVWRGGQAPPSAGEGGICGTDKQWYDGCGLDDPVPPFHPGSTIPACCGVPRRRAQGGTGTGGGMVQVVCNDLDTWPDELTVRLEGGMEVFGILAGMELTAFRTGIAPSLFVTPAFTIGATFGFVIFGCSGSPDFDVFCQLLGGSPTTIYGGADQPVYSINTPPLAAFTFPVTVPGEGSSPLTIWSIHG